MEDMKDREQKVQESAQILKTREDELMRNEKMFRTELDHKLKILRTELTDEIN